MDRGLIRIFVMFAVVGLAAACAVDTPSDAPAPSSVPLPTPVPVPAPPAIPLPPGAPPSITTLSFSSDPGEPIARGLSRTYYLGDGLWLAEADANHVSVRVASFADQTKDLFLWDIDLAAPRGTTLRIGTYEDAGQYPHQTEIKPGLNFSGRAGTCNSLSRGFGGRFVIADLALGPGNTVNRLNATFEQHCDGASPALRGQVVIASNPWR